MLKPGALGRGRRRWLEKTRPVVDRLKGMGVQALIHHIAADIRSRAATDRAPTPATTQAPVNRVQESCRNVNG